MYHYIHMSCRGQQCVMNTPKWVLKMVLFFWGSTIISLDDIPGVCVL